MGRAPVFRSVNAPLRLLGRSFRGRVARFLDSLRLAGTLRELKPRASGQHTAADGAGQMQTLKMKFKTIAFLTVGILTCHVQAEDKPAFKDQKDKLSYSIGMNWGSSLKRDEIEVNVDEIIAGLRGGLDGKGLLTETEMREVLTSFSQELQAKRTEKMKVVGEKNKIEGEKFLAENKTKEGVKTTASGLQYKIIKEGSGPIPKLTDKVSTNYRGTLIDGTEFDSSYKRGQPVSFGVANVIPGWTEALQMMKVGSKWQLFIPADRAYGERQVGQLIKPNSTLIFDIELVSIDSDAAAPAATPK